VGLENVGLVAVKLSKLLTLWADNANFGGFGSQQLSVLAVFSVLAIVSILAWVSRWSFGPWGSETGKLIRANNLILIKFLKF
jgi:hypothetical protein